MVEGLAAECARRKKKAHRKSRVGQELQREEALANGGGLLDVVELFVTALVVKWGIHVKRVRDADEAAAFAIVLEHKLHAKKKI